MTFRLHLVIGKIPHQRTILLARNYSEVCCTWCLYFTWLTNRLIFHKLQCTSAILFNGHFPVTIRSGSSSSAMHQTINLIQVKDVPHPRIISSIIFVVCQPNTLFTSSKSKHLRSTISNAGLNSLILTLAQKRV